MHRITKSERAYWLENDQNGDRIRLGAKELTEGFLEQFLGKGLAEMLMMCERFGKTIDEMELEKTMLRMERDAANSLVKSLRSERDEALRDLAAKTKEVVDLRAQIADARRERTSVTSQVRAVDEEPKAAPAVVKADAWPLLHGVFERLQAAENSARKGDTTSALLRVISAVRDLACVEQVPGGGK